MKTTNGSSKTPQRHDPMVAALPAERRLPQAPHVVSDLAEGCVRFVERALGVRLDYEPETLPLLDHWLEKGRAAALDKPAALTVVADAAGAYLGEVVRRRYASWWHVEGDDPAFWRIELESVYLSFSPVELVRAGMLRGSEDVEGLACFELLEDDRAAVAARLAELPAVTEEEYYAPSTRLEVIDIAVEAIRARRLAAGEIVDVAFGPGDYESD